MQETQVQALGWKDPLDKGVATHSSILAERGITGYSPQDHRESDVTEQLSMQAHEAEHPL